MLAFKEKTGSPELMTWKRKPSGVGEKTTSAELRMTPLRQDTSHNR